MSLSSILGAVTMALFVMVNDSTTATTDRTVNSSSARDVSQAWAAYLGVADGTNPGTTSNRIEWLTANDMLFYADVNNRSGAATSTAPPTMMWLRLDSAGSLVEEQLPSTAAINTAPVTCRVLALNVTATSLFTAYGASGNTLSGDLGTAPPASAGCQNLPVTVPSRTSAPDPVAVANLQNTASVEIHFTMSDSTNKHPLDFRAVTTLPTLGSAS